MPHSPPAALRRLLIKHEAERVPCRVQVNPEGRPGLHISLAGTQRQHVLLTDVEIRHIEVQVSLLRVLVTRPHRRLVARSTLESQRSAAITAQLHPVVVVTVGLPTRDRSVELRQGTRVTAIERYQTEPCNTSHAANSTGGPQQSWLRTRWGRHRRGRPGRRMGGLRIAAVGPAGGGVVGQGVVGVAGVSASVNGGPSGMIGSPHRTTVYSHKAPQAVCRPGWPSRTANEARVCTGAPGRET